MTSPAPPSDQDRYWAAQLALASAPIASQAAMRIWVQFWWRWLTTGSVDPVSSIVITATIRNKQGEVIFTQTMQGGNMATALTMDDTLTLAASETDDHQDPVTSDQLALNDPGQGTLMNWVQSGNTWTGTPLGLGSGSASIADPSAPQLAAGVTDYTIAAGAPSAIQVTATVNTGANAAPPAGAPAARPATG